MLIAEFSAERCIAGIPYLLDVEMILTLIFEFAQIRKLAEKKLRIRQKLTLPRFELLVLYFQTLDHHGRPQRQILTFMWPLKYMQDFFNVFCHLRVQRRQLCNCVFLPEIDRLVIKNQKYYYVK